MRCQKNKKNCPFSDKGGGCNLSDGMDIKVEGHILQHDIIVVRCDVFDQTQKPTYKDHLQQTFKILDEEDSDG